MASDRRDGRFLDGRDGLTDGLTYAHNLISKPHFHVLRAKNNKGT